MKKKSFRILAGILALCGIYLGLRSWATDQANKETDAFFAEFRKSKDGLGEDRSIAIAQDRAEVSSTISKHMDAIRNFSYETTTPELNLLLNETKIEVSWHLTIIFAKHSGRWQPVYFDEYKPNPRKE